MIALPLLTAFVLQQAGGLFSYERWDNTGDELPADKDWLFGGAFSPGDVDADGTDDLAVWVIDNTGSNDHALVVLFLQPDGSVRARKEVPLPTSVTRVGSLNMEFFPPYAIGDVNGDGTPDVGSIAAGGMNIIKLTPTGDVLGIDTVLLSDWIRQAAVAGDVDGDGVVDLVTSENTLLFLDAAGAISSEVPIDPTITFSHSAAGLGDLDLDGVPDVALGGFNGTVYVVFLRPDGTARSNQRHFTGYARGGVAVAAFDLDGDGRKEISASDSIPTGQHVLLTAFLNADGSVASTGRIDVPGDIPYGLFWGLSIAFHSDGRLLVNGDSWLDLLTLIPSVTPASSTARNAGTNAASYGCVDPVLGMDLVLTVDVAATGHLQGLVIGFDSPFQFTLPGGQTVLCLDLMGGGELVNTGFFPGPLAQIPVSVPNDVGLIGFTLSTQAVSALGSVPFALSNACDLVLGF